MTSKKTPRDRRAVCPRRVDYAKTFLKDWEKLDRTGRLDMRRLKEVVTLVFRNDGPLAAEWNDHPLKGEWADHRECHVGGDFLLIYRLEGDGVVFVRAGTHAELFE